MLQHQHALKKKKLHFINIAMKTKTTNWNIVIEDFTIS